MINKAVQRLWWRFSEATKKGGTFTVNQTDLDALTQIAGYVEQDQKKQYEANELFAKMYVHTAMKIMEQDNTTVFDNNHRRKIGNLLKMPISQVIQNLVQSLNDSELYSIIDESKIKDGTINSKLSYMSFEALSHVMYSKGSTEKDIALKRIAWDKQKLKESDNLERLFKENPDAFTGKTWTFDSVEPSIIAEVNQQINLNK
jgi:hypothetical protein|tara:strand:- start:1616 stop:2221 length:606 start_codon:yes stop_codon:yes gene_type:complete